MNIIRLIVQVNRNMVVKVGKYSVNSDVAEHYTKLLKIANQKYKFARVGSIVNLKY